MLTRKSAVMGFANEPFLMVHGAYGVSTIKDQNFLATIHFQIILLKFLKMILKTTNTT